MLTSPKAPTGLAAAVRGCCDASIAHVIERFAPHVESMEGAAFMYACLVHWQRFAQVRAVSNFVERRNRSAWNLPAAITNLGSTALRMLGEA